MINSQIKATKVSTAIQPPASIPTPKTPLVNRPILVSEKDTAHALGVATITLRCWRLDGKPVPRWTRLGTRILYERASVLKFVENRLSAHDAEV